MNIPLAFLLIFVSSIFGAYGTLMFKLGSMRKLNLKNNHMIFAVALAGISFFFYVNALKLAPLTFIYTTASISYIWAVLLGKHVLKEPITKQKVYGISLIILGIVVMHVPLS
jgi:multidrug transporter EmrE-like cation transporter